MLVLFPFEEEIYRQAGIPVAYVGHPLADMLPLEPDTAAARDQLRLPKNGPIIALLPGSQEGEVGQLGEIFIRAAQLMREKLPDCRFLVPLVSRETRMLFEAARYNADATELPMTVMIGHSRLAMQAADAVLVASGTATLEAALLKKPMVISYRLKPFSAFLVRRKLKVPYVGLPNILAGRRLVPELLQEDATPGKLAAAMLDLLADEAAQAEMMTAFAEMHRQLRQNCGEKAAQAILSLLGTAK
jgi:lipid-A-disaccharide synthase